MGASDVLLVILAIILPPVAVFIRRGCGADILINILLCLLGHIPGVIHALYIVLHDRERTKRAQAQYGQQTNAQAMYGAPAPAPATYRDDNIQQQPYGQQAQPMYFDQTRSVAPESSPPRYTDKTQERGEKQEYVPVANGALATKEI